MDAALDALLSGRRAALAAGLEASLLAHDAPHYREAPAAERGERIERLVAAFLEAVRAGGPAPFVAQVRRVAEERATSCARSSTRSPPSRRRRGRSWPGRGAKPSSW
jgi:hypothetical protein